jgi:hypothetical protein
MRPISEHPPNWGGWVQDRERGSAARNPALQRATDLILRARVAGDQSGFIGLDSHRVCSEPLKLDRFWLEFSAVISWLGGAESDEGLEVFGRPEGVHFEAGD